MTNVRAQETGLVLLELLLSMAISIGFLMLALEYSLHVFKNYHSWRALNVRVQAWVNWDSWVKESLNNIRARSRCRDKTEKSRNLSQLTHISYDEKKGSSDILTIHGCFYYHGKWQWLDKKYFTKKKSATYALYEKTESSPAQVLFPGVREIAIQCMKTTESSTPMRICRIELKWQSNTIPSLITGSLYQFYD